MFLVPLHSFSNIEITKYFNYEPRFNAVFSGNNFPRTKDGVFFMYLDGKNLMKHIGCHYLLTYSCIFLLLGIEYILQEVLNKIKDKSITHNMFRTQDNDSIMC